MIARLKFKPNVVGGGLCWESLCYRRWNMVLVVSFEDDINSSKFCGGDDEDSGGSGASVVGGDDVSGYDGIKMRYGEGGVVGVVSWGWR
ncbi:hypothetical protein Tco_0421931 [Tanacetum coccineum]